MVTGEPPHYCRINETTLFYFCMHLFERERNKKGIKRFLPSDILPKYLQWSRLGQVDVMNLEHNPSLPCQEQHLNI